MSKYRYDIQKYSLSLHPRSGKGGTQMDKVEPEEGVAKAFYDGVLRANFKNLHAR
jgi:hypothetical protein